MPLLRLYQQISHYFSAKYPTLRLCKQISHYYSAKYATLGSNSSLIPV